MGSRAASGRQLLQSLEEDERQAGRSVFLHGHFDAMSREDAAVVQEAAGKLLQLLGDERARAVLRQWGRHVR